MMTQKFYDLWEDKYLPSRKYPHIPIFLQNDHPIEFLELLSQPGAGQAYVFKVRIGNEGLFALKIFKFQDIRTLRAESYPEHNAEVEDFEFISHSDPFFAECRAYGRIAEIEEARRSKKHDQLMGERRRPKRQTRGMKKKRKGKGAATIRVNVPKSRRLNEEQEAKIKIAVPCYGFIGLRASEYEPTFKSKFGITDWNRPVGEQKLSLKERQPFRALVKQLVEGKPAIRHLARMLRDLKELRRGGVYPLDIAKRNYMDGLLVDFSVAWTAPHWCLEKLSKYQRESHTEEDLYDWDNMIEEEGIKTSLRAAPREDTLEKLRSYDA